MDYLVLLNASSRMVRPDKTGFTPSDVAPVLEQLKLNPDYWRHPIQDFGRSFSNVAGFAPKANKPDYSLFRPEMCFPVKFKFFRVPFRFHSFSFINTGSILVLEF